MYLILIEIYFLFPLLITLSHIRSEKNGILIYDEGIVNKNVFHSWNRLMVCNQVDDQHLEVIVEARWLFSSYEDRFIIESQSEKIIEAKKLIEYIKEEKK